MSINSARNKANCFMQLDTTLELFFFIADSCVLALSYLVILFNYVMPKTKLLYPLVSSLWREDC